ncbi:recombinase RecT [Fulvimarina endophytica]|nr:recombinase RecT [Fulvimarina endophytica]
MSKADIAIPKHLRQNPGACLAVCMQAFQWEMDPFAVAQKSYDVGGRMAYEAQLIAAVINTRAGLAKRPAIEYRGAGADRQCVVTFEADDGSTHVYESPRFSTITPKNSPLWKSDPDQQLAYYSVRAGARRHFPEVILGVYDRDELSGAKDVTPEPRPSLSARLAAAKPHSDPSEPDEGFSRSHVAGEIEGRQEGGEGRYRDPDTSDHSGDVTNMVDAGQGDPAGSGEEINAEAPSDKGLDPAGDPGGNQSEDGHVDPADEREPDLSSNVTNLLAEAASKFLAAATNADLSERERQQAIGSNLSVWKKEIGEDHHDRLKKVVDRANDVITGKSNLNMAVKLIAAEIGAREEDVRP